jgi:hypothetical protein
MWFVLGGFGLACYHSFKSIIDSNGMRFKAHNNPCLVQAVQIGPSRGWRQVAHSMQHPQRMVSHQKSLGCDNLPGLKSRLFGRCFFVFGLQ